MLSVVNVDGVNIWSRLAITTLPVCAGGAKHAISNWKQKHHHVLAQRYVLTQTCVRRIEGQAGGWEWGKEKERACVRARGHFRLFHHTSACVPTAQEEM